ncbi:MAG: diacylglycerol kinase family protein [Oscillospiraceae bacterium]
MKCLICAFGGIAETLKNERNMRIHFCFALYVILGGIVTKLSVPEWAAVLICIGLVMGLECVNTAIEGLCDTLCPRKSEGIRKTKDAAAGAVLFGAIISAIVGGIIFFQEEKLRLALDFFQNNTVLTIILVISLIPAGYFIRGRKRDKN